MLPPGHKLGEPSPLFAKIEQSTIDELKQKFAGKQQPNATNASGDSSDLKALEAEVTKQVQFMK